MAEMIFGVVFKRISLLSMSLRRRLGKSFLAISRTARSQGISEGPQASMPCTLSLSVTQCAVP